MNGSWREEYERVKAEFYRAGCGTKGAWEKGDAAAANILKSVGFDGPERVYAAAAKGRRW